MDDSPHLEQETTANAGHSHRCENAARCTTETGLLYGGSVEQKPLLASRIAVHGKIASLKVARNRWQNKTSRCGRAGRRVEYPRGMVRILPGPRALDRRCAEIGKGFMHYPVKCVEQF